MDLAPSSSEMQWPAAGKSLMVKAWGPVACFNSIACKLHQCDLYLSAWIKL